MPEKFSYPFKALIVFFVHNSILGHSLCFIPPCPGSSSPLVCEIILKCVRITDSPGKWCNTLFRKGTCLPTTCEDSGSIPSLKKKKRKKKHFLCVCVCFNSNLTIGLRSSRNWINVLIIESVNEQIN
jgi:hypothetical protein